MKNLDLNVMSPDQVSRILRNAADAFNESASDLASTWQDDGAGRVWLELAKILESAADRADRACAKHFV
jgi:acyl-CoA reductase-like NAD-dependent aldehyde dehydrogenase